VGTASGDAGMTYSWTLKAPQAKLYDADNNEAGTHSAGPTWTAKDGSYLTGTKVAQDIPNADAIPWLLLRAASHGGPDGIFSHVTYVQRVNTVGGKAPATGCDSTTSPTLEQQIAYSADYYFYTGGAPAPDAGVDSAADSGWSLEPPPTSAKITAPAGATVSARFHAVGVQIYTCVGTTSGDAGTTYAWTLKAPQATLYDASNQEAGTHSAGPMWTAKDGSSVTGMKVDQDTPNADAIPWLLLRAVSHGATDGIFSHVTYVQRVNTVGGKAPATGCDSSTSPTLEQRIDYSADYYFYTGGAPAPDGGVADAAAWSLDPPTTADAIKAPVGATVSARFHAVGVQIYTCVGTASGDAGTTYAWTLKAPQATLYDASNQEAGTHSAGPMWTAKDGSSVTGMKLAQDIPNADAIPWLLLRAVSHGATDGIFSHVTYVQRVNTVAGKAPATGCDSGTSPTLEQRIDYSADYYFYTGGAPTTDAGATN
jgi:hypothetical protein